VGLLVSLRFSGKQQSLEAYRELMRPLSILNMNHTCLLSREEFKKGKKTSGCLILKNEFLSSYGLKMSIRNTKSSQMKACITSLR
jgi:hypothetical protein